MLKIEEIRIGNYVNYFSESAERWFDNHVVDINMLECIEDGRSDHAHGIPLTEQWLLDLGFEKVQDNVYSIDTVVSPLRFCLWKDNFLWRFGFDGITMHCFKMDYVHQLQNLYYAITGQELQITP